MFSLCTWDVLLASTYDDTKTETIKIETSYCRGIFVKYEYDNYIKFIEELYLFIHTKYPRTQRPARPVWLYWS